MVKTSPGDFQVTTPEIPLLLKQVVTSKGILIPYTTLQLNPYPNTHLDLFYSDNFSFWCTTPKYVTNQLDFDNLYFWNTLNKTHQGIFVWNRNNRLHTSNKKHVHKERKETTDVRGRWKKKHTSTYKEKLVQCMSINGHKT